MNRLNGRVAIVTGASPNIGGALAHGLASEGAKVICTDIDPSVAQASAKRITDTGGTALAVAGDVTDPQHAEEAVEAAMSAWGRVDALVNNAVQFNHKGVLDMPVDEFRRQADIILTGAFNFTKAVAQRMIESQRGGSVINVLSTAAWQGQPGNIGYCTAKSGLINFTRSAAMELAQYKIRVNGFTPTATQRADVPVEPRKPVTRSPEFRMEFSEQFPWSHLPLVSDYVPTVCFLASDDSSLITGSNITVDGGASSKYWPWIPGDATDSSGDEH